MGNSQGSASCMASLGSALLCNLLASFSACVSRKSILWLPELRDLSDLKLKALDFLAGLCCAGWDWGVFCGRACWN